MIKIGVSLFVVTFLVSCAIGTPRITRGNSSSVEVWAGHMIESRHLADPLADQWCGKYRKDAVFIRVESRQDYYYICNSR